MRPPDPCILTVNSGSSSIKFSIFDVRARPSRIVEGELERIGSSAAALKIKAVNRDAESPSPVAAPGPVEAVNVLADWIAQANECEALLGIGHRIVQGGPKYGEHLPISAEMLEELERLSPFDPEHLPQEVLLIKALRARFPRLPQVACFDTVFHRDLPRVARLLPIPRRYEALGIRRYGFHGLSYEFLMAELLRLEGPKMARGRVILAHLGSGASLAAVRDGKSVDTSMSFTPAAGVPMGTRSGDLDPGLQWYLARTEGLDAAGFHQMVTRESGLLGVSGTSADMRDLLEREARDPRAGEAIDLFCYQLKKWIGGFAAILGGVDALVFAGGIGENAVAVRTRICQGLESLGIELDSTRNTRSDGVISLDASRVRVRVIRTREDQVIAGTVCRLLGVGREAPFGAE